MASPFAIKNRWKLPQKFSASLEEKQRGRLQYTEF